MQDFRNLHVWQESHRLTLAVYEGTATFPREEVYGLTSQLRRTGVSIEANIAEGSCRSSDAEFARFLHIAAGSVSELHCHLLIARDLTYLDESAYGHLETTAVEVKRMLASLIQKLRADS